MKIFPPSLRAICLMFPADADDGGDPNNYISIELTVGDHSGSHSERYGLLVGHVYHVAPTFGEVATTNYSFVRGKEYTFRVQWIDTKLSSPDYDYLAKIGCLGGGAGWLSGIGFQIHDVFSGSDSMKDRTSKTLLE